MKTLGMPEPHAVGDCLIYTDPPTDPEPSVAVYMLDASGLVVHELRGRQTTGASPAGPDEDTETACTYRAIPITKDAGFSLTVIGSTSKDPPPRFAWNFRLNDKDQLPACESSPMGEHADAPTLFAQALVAAIAKRVGHLAPSVHESASRTAD
jgi:hypothetical protein